MTALLLGGGLVAVFVGAVLFTNAVEWAGVRLGLGVGAVARGLADEMGARTGRSARDRPRARRWTRGGLVAAAPSFSGEAIAAWVCLFAAFLVGAWAIG